MESDVADDDRLLQWGEAERDERGHERLGVGHHEVEPAQVRAHHEVITLDVEHGRGLDGTGRLASAHGEGAAVHERLLAWRQWVASCVGKPRRDDWIVSFEGGRDRPPLAGDGAPGDATGTVTDDAHRVRRQVCPPIEDGGALRRVVLSPQRPDGGHVLGAGGLDGVAVRRGREHRLAHDGIVDQEEEVGRRAGEFADAGAVGLGPNVMPCGRPVRAEPVGIERPQPFRQSDLNRVVEDEPVGRRIDERHAAQPLHRIVGVLVQHGGETPDVTRRTTDAASSARRA